MSSGGKRPPVAVLLGGPSAEHDVSIVSGRAVAAALAERGHEVEGWLIDLAGGWWRLPAAALDRGLAQAAYDQPAGLGADGPFDAARGLVMLREETPQPVIFIALHGPFGEDGTVQALCESAGLVYTGAGVAASAVGMDKSLFKRLVGALGIPVVPWAEAHAADWQADRQAVGRRLMAFAEGLPDPRLIVKPARLGSSVGIAIVHRPADPAVLGPALDEAFTYDELVLAEAYLDHARELEMSVVGNRAEQLEVFGPGEVFPGHEFYDYHAKYDEGVSRTTDRPDVDDELRASLHDLAERAFLAIGASGFARVDFLLARDGRLYLNEINTIPGFTPISLFPLLCAEGGYDFGAISERIVELALERAAHRPTRVLTRADLP
ncbi:MAG TPA: D-alanine--D-alanine ligase family protein [Candidatus Limnocylindria bacterium]|nr:D-alanine--D-alanine ligase family protein [Candidatus Limnocylindria bacterium]